MNQLSHLGAVLGAMCLVAATFSLCCPCSTADVAKPTVTCSTFDSSQGVFNQEAGCSAVERFVDCEAWKVCYIYGPVTSPAISCGPIEAQTTYSKLCHLRSSP